MKRLIVNVCNSTLDLGLFDESKLPLAKAILKNRYIGISDADFTEEELRVNRLLITGENRTVNIYDLNNDINADEYELTEVGRAECATYLEEMNAKRKEILDAGKDTADETPIYTIEDLFEDLISHDIDEDGEVWNGFGVTDNYNTDYPLSLLLGRDFVPTRKVTEV